MINLQCFPNEVFEILYLSMVFCPFIVNKSVAEKANQ
jgi:hypothetical protein